MTARRRGAALWPGLTLACLLAVLAFVLSFDALRIVALACGVQPALAWMFPLIVDGSTLAFTWATWAFRTRGMGTWYPWLMLVLFSVVTRHRPCRRARARAPRHALHGRASYARGSGR